MNYYNSSNFIAYHIAENFCEEKLLRNAHLYCQWMPRPKISQRKLLQIATKPQNCETFLPKRFPATWYVM